MEEVLAERGVVGIGDAAAQDGKDLIIDLVLSEMAEGLDDGATDPPGWGHIPRGGVLEDDFPFTDPDLAGRAVGQENNVGWNLIRESEDIGGVGTGGLDPNGVPSNESAGDGISGGCHRAEDGVISKPSDPYEARLMTAFIGAVFGGIIGKDEK